jgi:hypothetical protein
MANCVKKEYGGRDLAKNKYQKIRNIDNEAT